MQKPEIRKAMNLGNRSMSDGLEIYKAMIEDTMQSVKTELVEAMNNYKVSVDSFLIVKEEWDRYLSTPTTTK